MATQNSQAESSNKTLDMVIVTLSVLIVCAGVFGFTFLTDQSMGIRLLALLGSIVVAAVVASFSPSGKRFIAFCRESWDELRRVVWPTKKETVNTTGLVMGFVVLVSFYLFIVDKFIEWGLYDGLLRLTF
ncbi:MAG: preprotein translocase subunit SecE [Duodenibacillus sp.]|nr:preprotein translocase subunit SecE [Duodenibacillus sp.]